MARTNRIVVEGGTYHLVSRIAHREFLLKDPVLKGRIVDWMYGIADFCGVEILAWSLMDNHFHIEAYVPPVPEEYWIDPSRQPEAAARSLRPAECRAPRWTPDLSDFVRARFAGVPLAITPAGDVPSEDAVVKSVADGVPLVRPPRPETGFALPESELLARIGRLYAGISRGQDVVAQRWARMRQGGREDEVEAEKDAFCRRMYNVSQFMKQFKQRISEFLNRECGHEGQLWDGRFYSGLVEDDRLARVFTTAYIDWNAPKAGLVDRPSEWNWCSFALACGNGPYSERARRGYERALGCPWPEAKAILESVFAAKIPEGYDPTVDQTHYAAIGPDGKRIMVRLTLAQLVKSGARRLFRGGFFGRHVSFVKEVVGRLPRRFPAPHGGVVGFLSSCDWSLPMVA